MLAGSFAGTIMLHNPGVTERLARLVTDAQSSDLPDEVFHQAKRSLLNFFAVALTGCRSETFEIAFASLAAFSGGKQAALIGRRERIDALSAAFLMPPAPMCSTSATPMCRRRSIRPRS